VAFRFFRSPTLSPTRIVVSGQIFRPPAALAFFIAKVVVEILHVVVTFTKFGAAVRAFYFFTCEALTVDSCVMEFHPQFGFEIPSTAVPRTLHAH
jgi:hypothetical protein